MPQWIDDEPDPAQIAEIERRIQAVRAKKSELIRLGLISRLETGGHELSLTVAELDQVLGDTEGGTSRREWRYRQQQREVASGHRAQQRA